MTIQFTNAPVIISAASVVGPTEGSGPLAQYFDEISPDLRFGCDTWEAAEAEIMRRTANLAIEKARLSPTDIDCVLAGDLLNQDSGSVYGARGVGRPFLGLFGACSAIAQGMALGALLVDGGHAEHVIASASSHFNGAEKTFRQPHSLGTQNPPSSGHTVTGDGAVVISSAQTSTGPKITRATIGTIIDMGQNDPSNMAAAMAPAAAHTIAAHLRATRFPATHYDVIATGDLGAIGSDLLQQLLSDHHGITLPNHTDCGMIIFDRSTPDVGNGGSGCGCAAATFAAHFYPRLRAKEIRRMLFVATGALHSTAMLQQGESIPGIAHLVELEV
jgi:stage V sporulation protein AD